MECKTEQKMSPRKEFGILRPIKGMAILDQDGNRLLGRYYHHSMGGDKVSLSPSLSSSRL